MSLIKLPSAPKLEAPTNISFEPPETAMARWNPSIQSAQRDDEASISIFDVIGGGFFDEGVTAKRIAAALRNIGDRDVTVNINSPGGDLFEGIAIYNLLRDHPHKVNVKVMGMAASAASIIAMAGDDIAMGEGSFQMMHNVWVLAIGDRNTLRDSAEMLESFDDAIAGIYSARSGLDKKTVAQMLDDETWLNLEQAKEQGFADRAIPKKEITEDGEKNSVSAARRIDEALKNQGMASSERRSLIWKFKQDIRKKPTNEAERRPTKVGASREEIREALRQ